MMRARLISFILIFAAAVALSAQSSRDASWRPKTAPAPSPMPPGTPMPSAADQATVAEVLAFEKATEAAVVRGDTAALERALAPTFLFTHGDGWVDGGAPLTFWAALVRNFTGFYERQILFAPIAASMIVFGPRRQRLGDIFARTFVVQHGALEMFKKQRAAELAQMRDQLAPQPADAAKPDEKKDQK